MEGTAAIMMMDHVVVARTAVVAAVGEHHVVRATQVEEAGVVEAVGAMAVLLAIDPWMTTLDMMPVTKTSLDRAALDLS
jgi:hypothetical protein